MSLGVWIVVFVLSAAVVGWAGVRLAVSGDEIAERSGVSRLVVGMLLVAAATSLPEIVIDVSAALVDAPDLAVGDLFGSSMANMAILALVDIVGRYQVWNQVEPGHPRVASVAIALTALATLGVLIPRTPALGWVGFDTLFIAASYVAALAWMRRSPLSRFGVEAQLPLAKGPNEDRPLLRPTVLRFAGATGLIFLAAPVVAVAAEGISEEAGIAQTFVGATLLALTTSLPELVASLAAVRLGAHDLAVGNLFGSNCFNMVALLFADIAYLDGPLLRAAAPGQAVAGLAAILLMSLALAAIVHGTEVRIRRLEPDAIALLVVYLAGLYAVWAAGSA